MVIGIDIDGVLTDIYSWQVDYGTKFCFDNKVGKLTDLNAYYSNDMFKWGEAADNKFWEEKIWDYAKNENARPCAAEVISKLSKEGNTIYIITAREYTKEDSKNGKKMRDVVKNWLLKYGIYYDNIFFTGENKEKVCIDNKVDVMIEDSPYNIQSLCKVVPNIICYDCSYNREVSGENIIRAYSWFDIYEKIKDLQSNI